MKHSSDREQREMEYARLNQEYLLSKREELKPAFKDKEPPRQRRGKVCCWLTALITLLAVYLVYYFVWNIKDVVMQDYWKKKKQVEELLPAGKQEVEKGIEQGEGLLTETQQTIDDWQNTYQQTKETIEETQKKYEELKAVKENIEQALGQ